MCFRLAICFIALLGPLVSTGTVHAAGAASILGAFPSIGGNARPLQVTIYAITLDAMVPMLTRIGETDIVGSGVTVDPARNLLTTTFDLTGATIGLWDVVLVDPGDPGNPLTLTEGFTVEDATLQLFDVLPSLGGEPAAATVSIHGRYFATDASAKLVRGLDEVAGVQTGLHITGVAARNEETLVTTFDLSGKPHGTWDLVVTNPEDAAHPATLPGAFTIEAGGDPHVYVDVVGPALFRTGRLVSYHILLGNRGNVDAIGIPMVFGIPADATDLDVDLPDQVPPAWDPTDTITQDTTNGQRYLHLPATLVRPGAPVEFTVSFIVPTNRQFTLGVNWYE
ncbi:MAG: hypothetical protein HY899_09180 [Deltaproteobacteria bacterium]|nr:hypothetical protein [Deltaproteobacteria bacterium]